MKKTMLDFIRNNSLKNGLLIVDPPTGFGKTYSTVDTIYERFNNLAPDEYLLYLTPQHKNLGEVYNELKKQFNNDKLFNETVLYIKSNFESLESAFKALASGAGFVEKDIPPQILTQPSYIKLKDTFDLYWNFKNSPKFKKEAERLAEEISLNMDYVFRKCICKFVYDNIGEAPVATIVKTYPWILRFYPHTIFEHRKVIIMSFSKFIGRMNSPFCIKSVAACFPDGKTTVFIDEFDSTKDVLLDDILANRTLIAANTFFSRLYTRLRTHKFKSFSTTDEKFLQLLNSAEHIFTNFHLDCNYISSRSDDTSYIPNKEKVLFHDNYYFSPVEVKNATRFINAYYNPSDEIVEIFYSADNAALPNTQQIKLPSLLNQLEMFFVSFQTFVGYAAEAYCERINRERQENTKPGESYKKMDYSEALSTIYNELGLDIQDDAVYIKFLNSLSERNTKRRAKLYTHKDFNVLTHNFYNKGFSYYAFKDADTNNEITKFSFVSIPFTPEKYLVNICQRFKVIGLSATALVPSALTNYNLDYMKISLGSNLVFMPQEKKNELKSIITDRFKAYHTPTIIDGVPRKVDLGLDVLDDNDSNDLLVRYTKLYPKKAMKTANDCYESLKVLLKNIDDKNDYYLERYVNVFEVMYKFFSHEDIRSLLCLNMKKADNSLEFNKEIIKAEFEKFKSIHKAFDAEIIFLEADNYDVHKKEIINKVSSGFKVFVIASYATVSKGQNFKFNIPSNDVENVFCICPADSKDERAKTKDFDAIFLNEITNSLSPIVGTEDNLHAIYEIVELYNCGELAFSEHRTAIGDVFAKKLYYRYADVLRKSITVRAGNTSAVMQAIGRITRTFNKKKKVYIFTVKKLLQQLDVSFIDEELLVPEMACVVSACKAQKVDNKDNELKRALNKMSIDTANTNAYILSLTHNVWTDEKKNIYEDIGTYLLKHPTISEADVSPDLRPFYICDVKKQSEYYYTFDREREYSNIEISFEPFQVRNFTVNEENSQLLLFMKFPGAKEMFEKNEYATSFKHKGLFLNPVSYRNIYKGRLGEVACKFILETEFEQMNCKIKLNKITDLSKYEKFDFIVSDNVYIDAKNWNDSFLRSEQQELAKIYEKMLSVNANAVFYVNLFSEYDRIENHQFNDGRTVYFVPRLLTSDGTADTKIIKQLFKELKRYD